MSSTTWSLSSEDFLNTLGSVGTGSSDNSLGDLKTDPYTGGVLVWDGSQWITSQGSYSDPEEDCKKAVKAYHTKKGLPEYDKLMELFFDAYPEYKL